MSREIVAARLRIALHHASVPSEPEGALPVPPASEAIADPVGLFVERGQAVGVRVVRAASLPHAAEQAGAWCVARRVRRAAVWAAPETDPIAERLRTLGIEVLEPGAPAGAVAAADVGVTGAQWAVAETGSLVLPAGPGRPRLASLLPPAHLAVLVADRILPDLPALFARTTVLPSALALITGPSRSADIGLVPVLGAHGPMEVTVLLVGSRGGGQAAAAR